ncbi:flavodoxin-like fold protein [Fusarium falciforme]|nr:flavodoxin-like fold protein [Fusarium falciforme]
MELLDGKGTAPMASPPPPVSLSPFDGWVREYSMNGRGGPTGLWDLESRKLVERPAHLERSSPSTPCTATSSSWPRLRRPVSRRPAALPTSTRSPRPSLRMCSPRCTLPPSPPTCPSSRTPSKLEEYDAFLLGIPTRYGNFPAQWKAFWDKTGKQWASGGFWGKMAGIFVSTASLGGGQETTAQNAISTLTHHGIIYVPFGYAKAFGLLTDLTEVRGGSAWGAGTFAGADGSRQPLCQGD